MHGEVVYPENAQMENTLNIIIIVALAIITFQLVVLFLNKRALKKHETVQGQKPMNVRVPKAAQPQAKGGAAEAAKLPQNELLYTILKNNTLTYNAIAFDLFYILDEVAAMLRSEKMSEKVELLYDVEEGLRPHLIGSPKRLSRILVNLIENGLKYSEQGVVKVRVRQRITNEAKCRVHFEIIDKGRGMSESAIRNLYIDPDSQENPKKRSLGFFVANGLVQAENGKVVVHSSPGAGTTVAVDIPYVLQDTKAPRKHVPDMEHIKPKVTIIERFRETADLMAEVLKPYAGAIDIVILDRPPSQSEQYRSSELIIVEERLLTPQIADSLKSEGSWLIETQSILSIDDGHRKRPEIAVDYLVSKPFTREHILEMLTVFYGAAAATKSKEPKASAPAEKSSAEENIFAHFISDAEIPVTEKVGKKDFKRFAGSKVLIVEDNPINQRVIKGLLGDSGIVLSFAENGVDALEVIEEKAPFDLVLMDINMPVLDGIETTRRIRTNPHYDSMPVVAFTGLNLEDQIEKMRLVGMNAHMAKPLNVGRTFSIFNHYLPHASQV